MKRSVYWHGVGMGTLLLLLLIIANADDHVKVPLDKIPKPDMEAVKVRFKDAAVIEAFKEEEDGELIYELSIKVKGQTVDVLLTPKGEFRLIKKTIAAKDLPAAVAKTLEDNYPKATYKELEEIILVQNNKEYPPYYEVLLVTARKKAIEVETTAEGKIIKQEKASD